MPMRIPPFNLTSHEDLVREMANHHGHLGNGTQPANTTNAHNSSKPSRVPSHDALVAYIADQHANLGNSSQLVEVTRDNNGTLAGDRSAYNSRTTALGQSLEVEATSGSARDPARPTLSSQPKAELAAPGQTSDSEYEV